MTPREIPILFLKATIKKMILVPGYYRNGTYVAPHEKMVHYDPDKPTFDVVDGFGSHSQKQALKKLSKHPGWGDLSTIDKHHHILSSATNIQNKATAAAQVSTFMSNAKNGKMPSDAEFNAFIALPNETYKEKLAILQESKAPLGFFKKLAEKTEVAYIDVAPPVSAEPKQPKQPSAEELAAKKSAQDEHDHYAKLVGDAASGPMYLKEAYKEFAIGNHEWELKHPKEQHADLMALYAKKQGAATASAAVSGWKKKAHAGLKPTASQWTAFMALPADKKVSMVSAAAVASGSTKHLVPPVDVAMQPTSSVSKKPATSNMVQFNGISVVAGSDGNPLKMHHSGSYIPSGTLSALTFFTPDKSGAESYGGAELHEAYLAIKNPANASQVKAAGKKVGVAASDFGMANEEDVSSFEYLSSHLHDKVGAVLAELKSQGFDGAHLEDDFSNGGKMLAGGSWVTFDSKQIADVTEQKSTTPYSSKSTTSFGHDNEGTEFSNGTFVFKYNNGDWEYHHVSVDGGWNDVTNNMLVSALNGGKDMDGNSLLVHVGPKDGDVKPGVDGHLVFKDGHWHKAPKELENNSSFFVLKKHEEDPVALNMTLLKVAKIWIAMHPGNEDDLSSSLVDLGYMHLAKKMGIYKPPSLPSDSDYETLVLAPGSNYKLIDNVWIDNHVSGDTLQVHPLVQAKLFIKTGKPVPKGLYDGLTDHQKMTLVNECSNDFHMSKMDVQSLLMGDPSHYATPAAEPVQQTSTSVYINTSVGHNKFWKVQVVGNSMVTTYGKIGTKGTSTTKEFSSMNGALAAMSKLENEKLSGGYIFVKKEHPKEPTEKPAPKVLFTRKKKAAISDEANIGPKEGDTKQGAEGLLVLKDGHWVLASKPTPSTTGSPVGTVKKSDLGAGVTDASKWAQTGPQAGSNAGGKFKDASGKEWYCKFPENADVVRNELLAAKFYEMFGVNAAKVKLIDKDGKLGLASKWIDGLGKGTPATLKSAHAGFAIDAWLANWDVVGLYNDNLLKCPDGAIRVDVGGSLLYRAMGGEKGSEFGDVVTELDSLRDKNKNPNSAKIFSGISDADLKAGGEKIALITNEQIQKMVEMFGPGDWPAKNALSKTLIARRKDIIKKLGIADPWNKPAPDETSLPVNASDLPASKDFSNWEGAGKGLSGSESLNKQNTIDHANLLKFAMQGNLVALKNYQYEAVDKESGKSLGFKPVGEHPSKWVKEDWSYLVELLDTIAHPSVAGLNMPSIGGGLADIANDSGFFKLGDRVATISADKRLGFWMKLAHAGDDFGEIVPKASIHIASTVVSAAKEGFHKLSKITRSFIDRVQANGSVNHIFSNGDTSVKLGNYSGGLGGLVSATYSDSIESPEGTMLYRWMNMSDAMVSQMLGETAGLIFQNTDSMCCSHKEAWSTSSHFSSQALVKIKYAKGAKALHSYASGEYKSENEITTLPGARFVLLSAKKGNVAGGKIEMEVLMLPPHEGFIADVENQAKLGKSLFIVIRDKIKGFLWNS